MIAIAAEAPRTHSQREVALALIVHGSLLIVLCFVSGFIQGSNLVMAMSLITAGVVAGASALRDIVEAYGGLPDGARPYAEAFVILGWVLTAMSAVAALLGFL